MTDTERIATALLGCKPVPGWSTWPDFTTLDECRLFEDELFRRNRKLFLHGHHTEGGYVDALCGELDNGDLAYVLTQATPAQRVKTCLEVRGFYS